jgi:assimilatory nitrate reductase catalytic subunit
MHWGGRFMRGLGVNALMASTIDPVSSQPELKHAAVQIEKYATAWQLIAIRRDDRGGLRESLQPWLARFDHATLTSTGREADIVVLRAWGVAEQGLPSADMLAELSVATGLDDEMTLVLNDTRRGISKRALIENDRLVGTLLCNAPQSAEWLIDLIVRGSETQALRKWLLSPLSNPPEMSAARGRVVCNCFDVSENEIAAEIAAGLDLAELQAKRKCGTSCGSCLPELRRMVASR